MLKSEFVSLYHKYVYDRLYLFHYRIEVRTHL